jgi:hypothetical protein
LRFVNVKAPASVVFSERASFVALFVNVTVAFGSVAPVESVTLPRISAVDVCAKPRLLKATQVTTTARYK